MTAIGELITCTARSAGLNREIVAAVILQESEGLIYSTRFEEAWFEKNLKARKAEDLAGFVPSRIYSTPSFYDEKVWRAHSWGLMHVLGDTARVLGFRGRFMAELLEPAQNLRFGCLYLKKCGLKDWGPENRELCRPPLLKYNGGGNPNYPDDVFRWLDTGRVGELFAA
jgi:hypothetical protein